jgi:hypothetical protein
MVGVLGMKMFIALLQRMFKWNRFVAVQQFLDADRVPHIIVLTRNSAYEINLENAEFAAGEKYRSLLTLKEAEKLTKDEKKNGKS